MNWSSLSYRVKNIVWLVGFLLVMIVAYFLAFERTFSLLSENKELQASEALGDNLPLQIASLNKKIQRYDSIVSISQESYQTRLMNTLASIGKKRRAKLIKTEEIALTKDEKYETFVIVFRGNYANLVRLVDDVESNLGLGSVQSVSFKKIIEKRTKVEYLQVSIYLTRIKSY